MSYDFQLFQVPDGASPMSAYKTHRNRQEAKAASRRRGENRWDLVDPSKEQMKRRLSTSLIASHPELRLSERDYVALARTKSITEDEARRRYRDLELSDIESGLQVLLFDDTAYITLPFDPESKSSAELRLRAAWTCLEVLAKEGSFSTYDSQLGKILNLNTDFRAVLQSFLAANEQVNQILRRRPI